MRLLLKILLIGVGLLVVVLGGMIFFFMREDIPAAEVDRLYSNSQSQVMVLSSGQRVHFRDQGRVDGAPILLLHGSTASLHTWEMWVERLGDRYRMITVDLPGHGLTGPHINEDYSKGAYVRFVDDFVRQLGLSYFVIAGSSMGGDIGWRYVLVHPRKIRGLILVGSGGYPNVDGGGPFIFSLLRYPFFQWLFQMVHFERLVRQGVEVAYNGAPVVTDRLVQRYIDLNLREGQRRATARRFAENMSATPSPPPSGLISHPTLILWGKEDALVPVRFAEKFHRDLPNSTLVIYDKVGHVPQEEIPGRSASDVRIFLESMDWGRPSNE